MSFEKQPHKEDAVDIRIQDKVICIFYAGSSCLVLKQDVVWFFYSFSKPQEQARLDQWVKKA